MRQSLGRVVTRLVGSVCRCRTCKLSRVVSPSWNGGYGYRWYKNARARGPRQEKATYKSWDVARVLLHHIVVFVSIVDWGGEHTYGMIHSPEKRSNQHLHQRENVMPDPQSLLTRPRYPTRIQSRRTACERRLQTLHLIPACGNEPGD